MYEREQGRLREQQEQQRRYKREQEQILREKRRQQEEEIRKQQEKINDPEKESNENADQSQNDSSSKKEKMSDYAKRKMKRQKDEEDRQAEKTMHNIRVLMEKRLEGLHDTCYNEPNSSVLFGENPIIDESKSFLKDLDEKFKYAEVPCETCMENYPGMRIVNARDGSKICQRCYNEKNSNKKHKDFINTFSKLNDMHFGDVPPCLKELSNIELASIKRICPLFSMYCRKGTVR